MRERREEIPSKNCTKEKENNTKMKIMKTVRKMVGLTFAVILFASAPMVQVEAAQQYNTESDTVTNLEVVIKDVSEEDFGKNSIARTAIYNCLINVTCDSEGMHVDFMVHANGTASEIGIKDIKIQKKVWYGWKTVATSDGAEAQNVASFGCSILYSGAEYGETYRITCIHYADVDGYTEEQNEIDSFVFTY